MPFSSSDVMFDIVLFFFKETKCRNLVRNQVVGSWRLQEPLLGLQSCPSAALAVGDHPGPSGLEATSTAVHAGSRSAQ